MCLSEYIYFAVLYQNLIFLSPYCQIKFSFSQKIAFEIWRLQHFPTSIVFSSQKIKFKPVKRFGDLIYDSAHTKELQVSAITYYITVIVTTSSTNFNVDNFTLVRRFSSLPQTVVAGFIRILRRMTPINHRFVAFPVLSVKNARSLIEDLFLVNMNLTVQRRSLIRFIENISIKKDEVLKCEVI